MIFIFFLSFFNRLLFSLFIFVFLSLFLAVVDIKAWYHPQVPRSGGTIDGFNGLRPVRTEDCEM